MTENSQSHTSDYCEITQLLEICSSDNFVIEITNDINILGTLFKNNDKQFTQKYFSCFRKTLSYVKYIETLIDTIDIDDDILQKICNDNIYVRNDDTQQYRMVSKKMSDILLVIHTKIKHINTILDETVVEDYKSEIVKYGLEIAKLFDKYDTLHRILQTMIFHSNDKIKEVLFNAQRIPLEKNELDDIVLKLTINKEILKMYGIMLKHFILF
jgi:hypothetical protein